MYLLQRVPDVGMFDAPDGHLTHRWSPIFEGFRWFWRIFVWFFFVLIDLSGFCEWIFLDRFLRNGKKSRFSFFREVQKNCDILFRMVSEIQRIF